MRTYGKGFCKMAESGRPSNDEEERVHGHHRLLCYKDALGSGYPEGRRRGRSLQVSNGGGGGNQDPPPVPPRLPPPPLPVMTPDEPVTSAATSTPTTVSTVTPHHRSCADQMQPRNVELDGEKVDFPGILRE
ncbi:unnamed protein product [Boreogadus saida]